MGSDLGADLRAAAEARTAGRGLAASFRGAAAEAQSITDHEWILSGPAETGKTWAWCWRLDSLLRSTPRAHAAIVRRVRADMVGSVIRTWERVAGIRGKPDVFGGKDPRWYDYPNGSRVEVAGLDRDSKTLSAEFDWLIRPDTLLKVEEGKYDPPRNGGSRGRGALVGSGYVSPEIRERARREVEEFEREEEERARAEADAAHGG